jgi:hypothetical protein
MNKPFQRLVETKLPREPPRIRDGQMGREGGDKIKEVRNEIKQRRVGIAAQTTRREPQTAQWGWNTAHSKHHLNVHNILFVYPSVKPLRP